MISYVPKLSSPPIVLNHPHRPPHFTKPSCIPSATPLHPYPHPMTPYISSEPDSRSIKDILLISVTFFPNMQCIWISCILWTRDPDIDSLVPDFPKISVIYLWSNSFFFFLTCKFLDQILLLHYNLPVKNSICVVYSS